jgi:hypothetical protein
MDKKKFLANFAQMLIKTLYRRGVKYPLIDILFDIFSVDYFYFRRIRTGKIQILLWIRPNLQPCEYREYSVCEIGKNAGKI